MAALTENHYKDAIEDWVLDLYGNFKVHPNTASECNVAEMIVTIASQSCRKGEWMPGKPGSKASTFSKGDIQKIQDIRCFRYSEEKKEIVPVMLSKIWDRNARPKGDISVCDFYEPSKKDPAKLAYSGIRLSKFWDLINEAVCIAAGKTASVELSEAIERKMLDCAQKIIRPLIPCLAAEYDYLALTYPKSEIKVEIGSQAFIIPLRKQYTVGLKGYNYPPVVFENIEKKQCGAIGLMIRYYKKAIRSFDVSKVMAAIRKTTYASLHKEIFIEQQVKINGKIQVVERLTPNFKRAIYTMSKAEAAYGMRPIVRAALPTRYILDKLLFKTLWSTTGSTIATEVFKGMKVEHIDLKGRGNNFMPVWRGSYTGTIWCEQGLAAVMGQAYEKKEDMDYTQALTRSAVADMSLQWCFLQQKKEKKGADIGTTIKGQVTGNHAGHANASTGVRVKAHRKIIDLITQEDIPDVRSMSKKEKIEVLDERFKEISKRFSLGIPLVSTVDDGNGVLPNADGTWTYMHQLPPDPVFFNSQTKETTYKPKKKAGGKSAMTKEDVEDIIGGPSKKKRRRDE